ncbi:MAG: hypothetical protein ACAH07_05895 [Methylophilaceae bacterium]|nr:hypothetical protein [Methyloradius sp.]
MKLDRLIRLVKTAYKYPLVQDFIKALCIAIIVVFVLFIELMLVTDDPIPKAPPITNFACPIADVCIQI